MAYRYNRYNKYHNKKTTLAGKSFDSQKEGLRYLGLLQMERDGRIRDLKTQVKFVLSDAKRDENGKLLEREAAYIADFTYYDSEGNFVVEDVKGMRTPEYVLKRKWMLDKYGIRVKEW